MASSIAVGRTVESLIMAGEILIVDENPGVQRILKRFLSQNGYSVTATDSVQSAISLLGQSPPSLVILDIKMPRSDGIEFIRQLRESAPLLPIIVMTAYPTFFSREEALKSGIKVYITKPFDSAQILQYIRQLLSEELDQANTGGRRHEIPYSKTDEVLVESGNAGKSPFATNTKE